MARYGLLLPNGFKIRALRKATNMTQQEFAEYCGLSLKTYKKIERCTHVERKSVRKVAAALQVEIYELAVPAGRYSEFVGAA